MNKFKYLRVSVTTSCNVNCWYCFNEGLPQMRNNMVDVSAFKWFIKNIVDHYGVEIVRFTGGEPLINPKLIELIEALRSLPIKRVGLTTNGKQLLRFHDDFREQCIINSYAVHICDANEEYTSIEDIVHFVEEMQKIVDNVRFNIVVTSRSIEKTLQLLEYAVNNPMAILLLDLMQANLSDDEFTGSYVSLTDCKEFLLNNGFSESIENTNAKIYHNEKSSIKLVEHYFDAISRCVYCTRKLDYNPLLLTPNFDIGVCNHFGKRYFSVKNSIDKKDENGLFKIIDEALYYLEECNECSSIELLTQSKKKI